MIPAQHMAAVDALLFEQLTLAGKQALAGDGSGLTSNLVIMEEGLGFVFVSGSEYYECILPYGEIMDYITLFQADPTPAPTTAPAPMEKPEIVEEALCAKDGVHVRAEPDTQSTILAVVQSGSLLEVTKLDAGNGFTQIWYNDGLAYIRTSYLALDNATPAPELPTATETGYVTGNGVHVRAGATTRSKKLGTLKYGAEVAIVTPNYTNNWHQILYEGAVAYISARYVSIGSMPAVTPAPTIVDPEIVSGPPYIQFVGTCSTNGVIIRVKASTTANYYGKLYQYDEVQVMEAEVRSGWDKVWIPVNGSNTRGYIGYVHSKYIEDLSVVVPVVQAPGPVIPVVQATPIPVIIPGNTGPAIGSGVIVNP